MSTAGDALLYHNGVEETINDEYFSSRQMLYIVDQNAGVYSSGQVQFDCQSLANNSSYLNWSEGYFAIPFVAVAKTDDDGFTERRDFLLGLKNGSYQIINSMTVEINGKSMVNLTPYLNEITNYKLMSELSADDEHTLGDLIMFHPDSARSVRYTAAHGIQNNLISNTVTDLVAAAGANTSARDACSNVGLARRQMTVLPNASTANGLDNIFDGASSSVLQNKSTFNAANKTQEYQFVCIIRLRDICDLFAKMDMPLKGIYARFQIGLNQGTQRITGGANIDAAVITSTSVTGNTFPVIASLSALALANTKILDVACGVSKVTLDGATYAHALSSCRLYVPAYKLRPEAEVKYLANKVKSITYDDVMIFQVTSIPASGNTNSILTNGIANPTKLVICPHISASSNGTGATKFSPLLSSLSSEPATTSPIPLTNLNLLLAGQSVLSTTEDYNYEMFINERRASVLNGGLTNGVSSGLIGLHEWQLAYHYHVFNLLYRNPESRDVPISVQLLAKNGSKVNVDLNCFIFYQRSFNLDITTGSIV